MLSSSILEIGVLVYAREADFVFGVKQELWHITHVFSSLRTKCYSYRCVTAIRQKTLEWLAQFQKISMLWDGYQERHSFSSVCVFLYESVNVNLS